MSDRYLKTDLGGGVCRCESRNKIVKHEDGMTIYPTAVIVSCEGLTDEEIDQLFAHQARAAKHAALRFRSE